MMLVQEGENATAVDSSSDATAAIVKKILFILRIEMEC